MRKIISRWKVVPNFIGGNRLVDLCGRNHGVLTNNPTWSSAMGRFGGSGSLLFNGSSNYVLAAGMQSVGTSAFVISCWVMWTSTSVTTMTPMSIGNAPADDTSYAAFLLNRTAAGQVEYVHRDGSFNQRLITSLANTWNDGRWHHLFASSGGTSGTSYLFIDGNEQGSGASPAATTTTSRLSIGNRSRTTLDNYFPGYVDDAIFHIGTNLRGLEKQLAIATRQKYDPTLNYNNFINFNRFKYNYLSMKVPSLGYLSVRG